MTTTSYATPEDIEDKIGYTDGSVTDTDLQKFVEKGARLRNGRIGRHFVDEKRVDTVDTDGDVFNEFELRFRPVLDFSYIEIRNERVPDSKYEVDKTEGVITFDQDYVDNNIHRGDVISFYYVPKIFKDLEGWYAAVKYLSSKHVQSGDEQLTTSKNQALEEAVRIERRINASLGVGTFTDGRNRRFYK